MRHRLPSSATRVPSAHRAGSESPALGIARALGLTLTLSGLAACSGGTPAEALPTEGITYLPACSGDNNGVISVGELHFTPGLLAPYAVQRANSAPVQAGGDPSKGTGVWDFSQTQFEGLEELPTLSPAGFWYADAAPDANLVIPLNVSGAPPSHLLLRNTPEAVDILGVASVEPDQLFLQYTAAVPFMRFPMALGDARSATVAPADGFIFEGQPLAPETYGDSNDTYTIEVGGRGALRLPGMQIDNVLALSLRLERFIENPLTGDTTTTAEQTYLVHECLGTVAVRSGPAGPWRVIWYPR